MSIIPIVWPSTRRMPADKKSGDAAAIAQPGGILKVARTLADLDDCDRVSGDHVLEAIQYRPLERNFWE